MIGCCNNCYDKYININGQINWENYIKVVRKNVNLFLDEADSKLKQKQATKPEDNRGLLKYDEYSFAMRIDKICQCRCHIEGLIVRH